MENRYLHSPVQSEAQLDELEKIALSPGGTAWAGRLIGAGIGAAGGGYAGSQTAGDPTSGAIRGAMLGGLAGLAGGQIATKAGRGQVQRFGQRQLHGVTGYMPGRGLVGRGPEGTKWYRLGKKGPELTKKQRVDKLKDMEWGMLPTSTTASGARQEMGKGMIMGPLTRTLDKSETGKKIVDTMARHKARVGQAQQTVAETGMTSVPGAIKGYTGQIKGVSPLQAAKANLLAPGVAMGVGLPVASGLQSVQDYRNTGDASALGRGMAENLAFGAMGAAPMIPSMAFGELAGRLGGAAGKGIEAVQNRPTRVVPRQ